MSKSKKPPRPKGASPSRHPKKPKPAAPLKNEGPAGPLKGPPWLYGRHAVIAALANPKRNCHRLIVSQEFLEAHGEAITAAITASERKRPETEVMDRAALEHILSQYGVDGVHQGVALQCAPLAHTPLEAILEETAADQSALFVALDQATDPQNIGAVLRSAAAFGAQAVLLPERNAPDITPALAKAACGAVERIAMVRVTNLTRSLKQLQESGFWSVGLDGYAEQPLDQIDLKGRIVLVMGSEGTGLRRLTRETCDFLAKIPISQTMESLNLSNATAISLYECARQRGP